MATAPPAAVRLRELIVVRDIAFRSVSAESRLPFYGSAHVAYLPAERTLGVADLARVVDRFAGLVQRQERLTSQIAAWLDEHLRPRGVGVVLEARHPTMPSHGRLTVPAQTITSALRGLVRDDPRTREEFLSLTARRSR